MSNSISRRAAITNLGWLAALAAVPDWARAQNKTPIVVYKDPNCGCCAKWIDHMKANGFTASVTDTPDMTAIKTRYQVGDQLRSCHTTIVGGYVIEGHVPAGDVKKLLLQKPKGIVGLTIPGMPASAPGMDMTPFVPYTVLTFDAKGGTAEFAKHSK
jgi:hypothetical protein